MIEVEEDLVAIEIMVKEVPEEILEIVQEVASTAKNKVIWPDNALNPENPEKEVLKEDHMMETEEEIVDILQEMIVTEEMTEIMDLQETVTMMTEDQEMEDIVVTEIEETTTKDLMIEEVIDKIEEREVTAMKEAEVLEEKLLDLLALQTADDFFERNSSFKSDLLIIHKLFPL